MRKRGLLFTLALLAMLPVPAARADLPEIAGTMVVEGSTPAFVDVRVPSALDMKAIRWPVEMEGGGDYVRVELRQLIAEPGMLGPNRVAFDRIGPDGYQAQGATAVAPNEAIRIPAGTYRMYLHTTSPVRVTLHIAGMSGARVFRPRRAATGTRVRAAEMVVDQAAGVRAWGASDQLDSRGDMRFWAMFDKTPHATADRLEACLYIGGDEDVAAPYMPGCPTGIRLGGSIYRSPDGKGWSFSGHYSNFSPNRYGNGMNFTRPGGAPEALFPPLATWSSFDDAEDIVEEGAPVVEELGAAAPPPPPMPAAPGAAPAPVVPVARLRASRVKVRGRRALLPLACPAGGAACTGSAALGTARAVLFSIPAGRTRTVRVPLPRGRSRRSFVTLVVGAQQLRFPVSLRR